MLQIDTNTVINETFRIDGALGEGGMGAVYRAWQFGLERGVAIKFLLPGLVTDKKALLRFERESKILMALRHRNLVQCYQFGVWQSCFPFIAMELLEGKSLKRLIEESSRVDADTVLNIAIQACEGLTAIHAANINHRDIKPENLFLQELPGDDGYLVKIIDFGLAGFLLNSANEQLKLTQTGALVGSIYYLSPELCKGQVPDARADIYSLGCVLYESLLGEPPLVAEDPIGMIYKHVSEHPARISERAPELELPDGLELVLRKAMAKDPDVRYASAADFKTDLEAVRNGNSHLLQISENIFAQAHARKPRIAPPLPLLVLPIILTAIALWWSLFTEPGLGFIGRTFLLRSSQSSLTNFCSWLESTNHAAIAAELLNERASQMPSGSIARMEVMLMILKLQLQAKQPVESKKFVRELIAQLASMRVQGYEDYMTWQQRSVLLQTLQQAAVLFKDKNFRWEFDRETRWDLGRLCQIAAASGDVKTVVELRRLLLRDDACRQDTRFEAQVRVALAQALRSARLGKEAELEIERVIHSPSMPRTQLEVTARSDYANILRDAGMSEDADEQLQKAWRVAIAQVRNGVANSASDFPIKVFAAQTVVLMYRAKLYQLSLQLCEECRKAFGQKGGPDSLTQLHINETYVLCLISLGRDREAEAVIKKELRPSDAQFWDSYIALYTKRQDATSLDLFLQNWLYRARAAKTYSDSLLSSSYNQTISSLGSTGSAFVSVLMARGRWSQAVSVAEELLKLADKHPVHEAYLRQLLAEALSADGKKTACAEQFEKARNLLGPIGTDSAASLATRLRQAVCLAAEGNYGEAGAMAEAVFESADTPAPRAAAIELCARCKIGIGDFEGSIADSRSGMEILREANSLSEMQILFLSDLLEAYSRAGRLSDAAITAKAMNVYETNSDSDTTFMQTLRAKAISEAITESGDTARELLHAEVLKSSSSPFSFTRHYLARIYELECSAISKSRSDFELEKRALVEELIAKASPQSRLTTLAKGVTYRKAAQS